MSEQPASKAQKIFYVFLAAMILVPIIWMTVAIIQTKDVIISELLEINKNRDIAFVEIRPALMRYKEEQGTFPDTLNKLVPKYIISIPDVLLITKDPTLDYDSKDMSVKYIADGTTASFQFRRGYDHTPMITYDVLTGTYSDKIKTVNTGHQN